MIMDTSEMKTMTDRMGDAIPIRHVSKYDRKQDRTVQKIYNRHIRMRELLEACMKADIADIRALLDDRGQVARKGNITLSSFDGNRKIQVKVRYNMVLDDRAIKARDMMLNYLTPAAEDIKNREKAMALMTLVRDTFSADKAGYLNQTKVNHLIGIHITAKVWQDARALLIDSRTSQRGKSYIVAEARRSRQQNYESVILDFSKCWPLDDGGLEC